MVRGYAAAGGGGAVGEVQADQGELGVHHGRVGERDGRPGAGRVDGERVAPVGSQVVVDQRVRRWVLETGVDEVVVSEGGHWKKQRRKSCLFQLVRHGPLMCSGVLKGVRLPRSESEARFVQVRRPAWMGLGQRLLQGSRLAEVVLHHGDTRATPSLGVGACIEGTGSAGVVDEFESGARSHGHVMIHSSHNYRGR